MLVSVHDLLGVRWLQRRHRGRGRDTRNFKMDFGFMAHWYAMAISHPYDVLWNGIGFVGQAVFGVRIPDPVAEERAGRP